MDDDGAIELVRDDRLFVAAEIVADLRLGVAVLLEDVDRLGVGDAREGGLHFLELRRVALERLELLFAISRHAADDVLEEVLGELHVALEIHERDLGLDHPELGEVAARLRFLRAERRAEAVRLAERGRRGLHVELARLREVRGLAVVVGLEEVRRALARVGREDRRVDEREAAAVEEVAHALMMVWRTRKIACWRCARSHRWRWSIRKSVENTCSELLRVMRVLRGDVARRRGGSFTPISYCPLILPCSLTTPATSTLDSCWSLSARSKVSASTSAFEDDALDDAGAVAHLEEVELAARALVVEPPVEGDLCTYMVA